MPVASRLSFGGRHNSVTLPEHPPCCRRPSNGRRSGTYGTLDADHVPVLQTRTRYVSLPQRHSWLRRDRPVIRWKIFKTDDPQYPSGYRYPLHYGYVLLSRTADASLRAGFVFPRRAITSTELPYRLVVESLRTDHSFLTDRITPSETHSSSPC